MIPPRRSGVLMRCSSGGSSYHSGNADREAVMALVVWLQELDAGARRLAGGKAANLGELLRAGLPVPPGFVVTTVAYDLLVTSANLQGEIERLAAAAHPDDPAALEEASQAIAALLATAPRPG